MIWTDEFLSRCLDGLPKDKYHDRAKAELTDHLLELAQELESGGYSPEAAHEKALELMGDPDQLRQSFQEQWRQRAHQIRFWMPKLMSIAFCSFAFRVLLRHFVLYPPMFLAEGLFNDISNAMLILYPVALALFNFWPGAQMATAEIHRAFSLFSLNERKIFALRTSLLSWLLEIVPVVCFTAVSVILSRPPLYRFDSYLFLLFYWITGLAPMMYLDTALHLLLYLLTTWLVCVFFPLIYCPRSKKISSKT